MAVSARLKRCYYLLAFAVTVIDNPFTAPFNDYEPFTETVGRWLYPNIKTLTGLAVPFSVFEWATILLAFAAWRQKRPLPMPRRDVQVLSRCFFALLAFTAVRSLLVSGGDASAIYWAFKGPLVMPFMIYATFQLMRTAADFTRLGAVVIAGVTLKALQGLYYYYGVLGGVRGHAEYITSHVGSYVMSIAILSVLVIHLVPEAHVSRRGKVLATLALVPIVSAFLLNQRRVEMAGLLGGAGLIFGLLLVVRPRRILGVVAVAGPVLALYSVLGQEIGGLVGAPLRMLESLTDQQNSSNFYRQIENFDLVQTLMAHPLFGQGVGVPFDEALKLIDISALYSFYLVNPHNSILWLWTSMGVVGVVAFAAWIGTFVMHGVRTFLARSAEPWTRLVLLVALANVLRYLTFCFGDMMFYNSEGSFFLAVSLGAILAACRSVDAQAQQSRGFELPVKQTQRQALPGAGGVEGVYGVHARTQNGS